jgi:hypothetical protein
MEKMAEKILKDKLLFTTQTIGIRPLNTIKRKSIHSVSQLTSLQRGRFH